MKSRQAKQHVTFLRLMRVLREIFVLFRFFVFFREPELDP